MDERLLIYGATGYTGRLISRAAARAVMPAVLCGRNEQKLRSLASELALEFRVARTQDSQSLDTALQGIRVVLNAAGPFGFTAPPLIDACLRRGAHYLDVTAEAAVMEAASRSDRDAKARKVMVMPAVGFDVVPSDCLARHVASRCGNPRRLFVGISGLELMTPGSAKTIINDVGEAIWVRRGGVLERVPPGALERTFDFGVGPRRSVAVTWGDVVGAYYSTGIPDITIYFEATPAVSMHTALVQALGWAVPLTPWRELLKVGAELLPEGPSEGERLRRRAVIVAEVEDGNGQIWRSRMKTPEAYTMTAATSTTVAGRVLAGDFEPGFQTPARVYGADFPLTLATVEREDL
jgi:short subunit dehydrogenase-like uncharacterized protein